MISLLLLWLPLALASLCLGLLAKKFFRFPPLDRGPDEIILSLWVGFMLLHVLLLAISLPVPLTPAVFVLVFTALFSTMLLVPGMRARVRSTLKDTTALERLSIAVWLCLYSAISVQAISNRDAVSYHFDIIYWLSRLGVTPGLALIHERLGYL